MALGAALLTVPGGPGGGAEGLRAAQAAPKAEPIVLGVLGSAADGRRLASAEAGVRAATSLPGLAPPAGRPVEVLVADDGGSEAGLDAAIQRLKAKRPVALVALPGGGLRTAYAEAAKRWRVPWFVITPWDVDGAKGAGNVWALGPSVASQGVAAGDALRSPLGAASVAVVHEPTPLGLALSEAVARNRPPTAADLGARAIEPGQEAELVRSLGGIAPDWVVVAATGRHLEAFVRALAAREPPLSCLFLDGARSDALLAEAPRVFAGSVVLGGPDPEGEGRVGETLLSTLEAAKVPLDETAVRAAEAARRLLLAAHAADGTALKKLVEALAPETPVPGLLGTLGFEPPGSIRFFPQRFWRVRNGRFEEWPPGLLPTPECGPPLGFARVPPCPRSPRGRLGWLTWGEKPVRTIEQDLAGLGLVVGASYDPEMDALVKDEILARAIRIAYRLFRREADGTPIPGWSWGMTFTTEKPAEITPSTVWIATVAGDDPAAGGRVTGANTVSVFSTFLKRTMYEAHRLDPPLTVADKPLLLARQRWGADPAADRRAQLIQCLIDGFASAIGMTLAHEFGHLCGCGHDTEHPTSIMNVVAGAGASWPEAVWIPSHQRSVTQTLGLEGLEK